VHLSGGRDDELDVGVTLLADIRIVFEEVPQREALATMELLLEPLQLEESPWRDRWSDPRSSELKISKAAPRKLAQALKPFGIRRTDIWSPHGGSRKGYRLEDFVDAWSRYLPSTDERDRRGEREPSNHAGSGLAHANPVSARNIANEREGRGEPTVSSRSRRPRLSRPSVEEEPEATEWLAGDGVWRSLEDDPPAFPGEVLETRYGRP
jgi:putative DNA primase/helicase